MTDEKTPPCTTAASVMLWAVGRAPGGVVTLTVYGDSTPATVVLDAAGAALLAATLLADGGDDGDAVAWARPGAACSGPVLTHHVDDLRPGELSECQDVIGDAAAGVFDGVANGGGGGHVAAR